MWLVVGISGVTCGGKSTLAKALHQALPGSQIISQDDYFLPEDSSRHILVPEMNHFNWEIMSSLDMEKMESAIADILSTVPPVGKRPCADTFHHVLIVEGFLILNYPPLLNLCRLKYYITLTREQCLLRRTSRVYNPPDVPGYFEKCVWPEYVAHRDKVLGAVADVKVLDGSEDMETMIEHVLKDVKGFTQEINNLSLLKVE
ncbi:unnamed protein product [Timema podura]|uniref:Nicotinamide riboside kinase 1 n=1 Tax=Timema podura TaxID=61482 RepID=A0ABN7NPV9_TIMPD|nr:unnamed protein product [Timema podura]